MTLSPSNRAALQSLFPELPFRGLSGAALDRAIDSWYARDHYNDNPAYAYDNEESHSQ